MWPWFAHLPLTMLPTFLVLSSLFRPGCNGYWHVGRGRQFFPMSSLCFALIHRRSIGSEARSCGKPDLLRINSCSCTDPICWLRYVTFVAGHRCYSYTQKVVVSLQNNPPLVSNKHLFSIIGVYLKLSLKIIACRDRRNSIVAFLSGPLRNQY